MSKRTSQVESTLKRAIAQVLERRISDPRIQGMVSITKLQVSPDLHDAYVWVSVLPNKFEARTISGLKHASKHIQSLARELLDMRRVPRLEFRLDGGLKRQAAIENVIKQGLSRHTEENRTENDEQIGS